MICSATIFGAHVSVDNIVLTIHATDTRHSRSFAPLSFAPFALTASGPGDEAPHLSWFCFDLSHPVFRRSGLNAPKAVVARLRRAHPCSPHRASPVPDIGRIQVFRRAIARPRERRCRNDAPRIPGRRSAASGTPKRQDKKRAGSPHGRRQSTCTRRTAQATSDEDIPRSLLPASMARARRACSPGPLRILRRAS